MMPAQTKRRWFVRVRITGPDTGSKGRASRRGREGRVQKAMTAAKASSRFTMAIRQFMPPTYDDSTN